VFSHSRARQFKILGAHLAVNRDNLTMALFTVEGLIKGYPSRWVIWTTLGSFAVKDFGSVGEGMLDYTSTVEANSEAEAIALFVSTYFPLSEDGPEVFDEVMVRQGIFKSP
jgi:hypothetical protein